MINKTFRILLKTIAAFLSPPALAARASQENLRSAKESDIARLSPLTRSSD